MTLGLGGGIGDAKGIIIAGVGEKLEALEFDDCA